MTVKDLKEKIVKIPDDYDVVIQDGSLLFSVDGVVDYPDKKKVELYSFKNDAWDIDFSEAVDSFVDGIERRV